MFRYALDAKGSVGNGRCIEQQDADDFSKAQGGNAQVVVAKPEHRHGDNEGKNEGYQAAQDD